MDSYDPTIENTFNKTVRVKNQEFELSLVDTAGQDEYSIFPAQYGVDMHGNLETADYPIILNCFLGYVLVYSINSTKSFEVVQTLYDKIVDQVGNPKLPVILVGNKKDLDHEREVSKEDGEKLARDLKAAFLETSAKDNLCVCDLFQVGGVVCDAIDTVLLSH